MGDGVCGGVDQASVLFKKPSVCFLWLLLLFVCSLSISAASPNTGRRSREPSADGLATSGVFCFKENCVGHPPC